MPEQTPRYRFRGAIKPTAEVKRPVKAYRNAESTDASGNKTSGATIDIFDVIDSYGGWWGISAAEVDAALSKLGDVDTLFVRINSPGGEATEGVAIANLLRAHASTVKVTNYGLAASAASLIAVSGDSLAMAPGSLLMIHEAWNVAVGSADDLRGEAVVLDKISDSYAACYALKGGTATDWRALMRAETWFSPKDAVTAGLADRVGIEASPGAPVNPDEDADLPIEVNVDVEVTPLSRAAARFDLSMFRHIPAAIAATQTPAATSASGSTEQTEEVSMPSMTDEQFAEMRSKLGIADENADAATVLAALDEALTEQAEPANATIPQGHVVVPEARLRDLEAGASAGVQVAERLRVQDREAFLDSVRTKYAPANRDAWRAEYDRDPEGTRKHFTDAPVILPVTALGKDNAPDVADLVMSDDEAEALAALSGTTKEALLNG